MKRRRLNPKINDIIEIGEIVLYSAAIYVAIAVMVALAM